MKRYSLEPAGLLVIVALGTLVLWSPFSRDEPKPVIRPVDQEAAEEELAKEAPKAPPAKKGFDLNQPESPRKPAPDWLKIVDLGPQDARLKGYKAPEGIKVEIVAENPAVINPVGMTFADDGTPYVLEWRPSPGDEWREKAETFTYKDGTTRAVATMTKRRKDLVKILTSGRGGNVWDGSKVLFEDELPSSILLHDGWVYLSGRGTVRRFKQSKPGGPYDVKQVIAQGFCGFHHHQVSGMTIGNDGMLYLTSGDDDNYAEGRPDGSRATVLRTGAIFRCKPDGSKLQAYAMGFRNPYRDVAFDSAYNLFHVDNDNEDGSKFMGCRLMHVPEGSDFGWRLFQGARCCKPDPVRGAAYGELPGKVPPMLKTGRGSPAGLLIYNDTRFPEHYRGLLLYPDVFRKLIRAYKVEQQGASFVVTEEFELLKSDDPLFRPCQMVLGPDGAIYVVDWRTDSGGAGRLWGDGKHGRIYRLSWSGTADHPALPLRPLNSWARFAKMNDADLLKALGNEDMSDREKARNELIKRGAKNRPALLKQLLDEDGNLDARIAALGALQSMWNEDVKQAFIKVLVGDSDLGRLAADGLALNAPRGDRDVNAALLTALASDDLPLRRAVALAMAHVGGPGAADNLASTLSFDDTGDVFLRDGLVRALEGLGKPGINALLSLAENGVQKDINRVVDTFTALRTRPGYEALPKLLKSPHVSDAQRAALVRSATNYLLDPPISLEPLAAYLADRPREVAAVKVAGLEVMGQSTGLAGPKASAWVVGLLDDGDARVRLAAIHAAGTAGLTKASPRLARMLAEPRRPAGERLALVKALERFREKAALAPLKAIVADARTRSPEADELRRQAFRTLSALDAKDATGVAKAFLEKDPVLMGEAIQFLGSTAEGARYVAGLYLAKKLPRETLPHVSEVLRKHVARDDAAAKQFAQVMKSGLLIKYTPAEVARIRAQVASKGNATRGRALYLNAKALACVNCHRLEGIGGSVGPDLTGLSSSMSIDKLLEALLDPSKEIKEGFQTFQVITKAGRTFQGLKMSQSPTEVVLREANGKDVRVRIKDVEELTALKTSLMPDNVVSLLSYAELIDLVAFLTDKKAQESLRGLALDFHVVGPFGGELKTAYAPEGKSDLGATYPGDKKWQEAQAAPSGLLDLKAIFNVKSASAYALTYVHSPKAQKAQMLLGSGGSARVWINGKLTHTVESTRPARADEDRVPIELKEGWNAVLAKVVNGEGGLYLRFAGEGLRVSRTPEGK